LKDVEKWGQAQEFQKEEILQVINENFIEMLLDIVNQNIQKALKKFQDDKNKNMRKHTKK
jgi:hypothetical protein